MTNFWKIECNICGINADLLTDDYQRIICRECLHRNEFNEVENEIHSDFVYTESNCEVESGHEILLHATSVADEDNRDTWIQEFVD